MRAWVARNLRLGFPLLSLLSAPSLLGQYTITTVAGGAPQPTPIAAVNASIGNPLNASTDSAGNLYFTSLNCVYKLDLNGVLTLVAGNSQLGYSGDGGPASMAKLNQPSGVAVDGAGNVYIADTGNQVIRQVSPSGIITTWAGNGTAGYSGDSGPAVSRELNHPTALAVDTSGNLYIADAYNNRVRAVSTSGIITSAAGVGTFGFSGDGGLGAAAQLIQPNGVALDSSGNVYIADTGNHRIRKVTPSTTDQYGNIIGGTISTVAGNGTFGYTGDNGQAINAELIPYSLAVDSSGNLYAADLNNAVVRKVSTSGIITTVAGNGTFGYSGDGGPATKAQLAPYGVAVDSSGNLYIVDAYDNRIRKVSTSGTITTVAGNGTLAYSGDGGLAINAQLNFPNSVAIDRAGNLYIADTYNNTIRQVSPGGNISTVAGNGTFGYSGDGGPAANAQLAQPSGVAVDSSGNLYIADTGNSSIREVFPNGIITTVAGNGTSGYSGDGGPAGSAQMAQPIGVALDSAGNLFIADSNNNSVREVSPSGIITTAAGSGLFGYSGDGGAASAAQLYHPTGVALDRAGNLYIADTYNNAIREVTVNGIINTVAGNGTVGDFGDSGPAANAQLDHPSGVALDGAGNLYIADSGNSTARVVSSSGIITTVAGTGTPGYSGDSGPAANAQLDQPTGVAVDSAGNVFVADAINNAVRLLQPVSKALFNGTPGH